MAYSIWCDAVSKRSRLTSTRRKETSVLPAGWGGRAVGESHHRTSRDDSAQRSGMSLKESRADALPATSAASRASHRETAPVRARHCCTSVTLPPANTTGPLPCGARADVGEDEKLEQQRRAKVTLRRADQREGGDERKDERCAKLQPVEGLIRRHDFDTTSEDHGTHDLDSQVGHLTRERRLRPRAGQPWSWEGAPAEKRARTKLAVEIALSSLRRARTRTFVSRRSGRQCSQSSRGCLLDALILDSSGNVDPRSWFEPGEVLPACCGNS